MLRKGRGPQLRTEPEKATFSQSRRRWGSVLSLASPWSGVLERSTGTCSVSDPAVAKVNVTSIVVPGLRGWRPTGSGCAARGLRGASRGAGRKKTETGGEKRPTGGDAAIGVIFWMYWANRAVRPKVEGVDDPMFHSTLNDVLVTEVRVSLLVPVFLMPIVRTIGASSPVGVELAAGGAAANVRCLDRDVREVRIVAD